MDDKLQICKHTREIAIKALEIALKGLLTKDKISEAQFRDLWLKEIRKSHKIFPDGWYIPPPHGIITLFATDKNPNRVLCPTMRPEETWPRDDIYLNKTNGLMALYASPIDKKTGIIGDTEVMVYLGKNKEVIDTYKTAKTITQEVFEFVKTGQKFSNIAKFASKIIENNGLANNILSTSDPNSVNLGHTIPLTYENQTPEEKQIFQNASENWQKVCQTISKKRVFLNEAEDFEVKAPVAFTIEPRLKVKNRPDLPSIWMHSIIFIKEDGSKELYQGFNEIFKICAMAYLLN